MTALAIIDTDHLAKGEAGLRAVDRQIGRACRDIGLFYVRGSALPAPRRDVVMAAHGLFATDSSIKEPFRSGAGPTIAAAPISPARLATRAAARTDASVECLRICCGPDRPPRYPASTTADYLRNRLDATYRSDATVGLRS